MKTRTSFYFVTPQTILIFIIAILFGGGAKYIPLNALRSIQIVRMIDRKAVGSESLADINLLKHSIFISTGNCSAYLSLGDRFIQFAFPKYDEELGHNNSLGYSSFLRQKGKYDETVANEIISIIDSGIKHCDRIQYQLHFRKGYLYYLMDRPDLALPEFEVLKQLKSPTDSPMITYEVMSKVYSDLRNPLNAGITLIFSMAKERKDVANEDISKIEKINQYLRDAQVPLIPNRNSGFGRYATATIFNNQTYFFGVINSDTSVLVYLLLQGDKIVSQEVIDAGNNVQLSAALDKDGYTHIAYLFGDRYIIYANSKDDFLKKTVIDANSVSLSVMDKPISKALDSIHLAVDGNGVAHLIWSYESGYMGYVPIRNNDDPNKHSVIVSFDSKYPDIETFDNGSVGIVYNNGSSFPAQTTQVLYRENNNGIWGDSLNVSKTSHWAGAANLIADGNGILHVFYITGSSANDVQLMHATRDKEGVWQQPEVIAEQEYRPFIPVSSGENQVNFGGRTAPSVTLLSENRIAVIWRGAFIDGATQVFGRVYSDYKWTPIENLGQISGQDYVDTQSIILNNDTSDIVLLVWPDKDTLIFKQWKP